MMLSRTKRKKQEREISFRKGVVEDASRIYSISKNTYHISCSLADLRKRLDYLLSQPKSIFYVAVKDNEVVGYVYATLETPLLESPLILLSNVAVDPENQNHGIGTLLVHQVEMWAQENQIQQMKVYCPDSHPDEKLQFFQQYNCDSQDCYYAFVKNLENDH